MSLKLTLRHYLSLILLALISLTPLPATAQTPSGTYVTTLPAGKKGPANANNQPATPYVVDGFNKPIQTNDWWSSLIWRWQPANRSENMFAHPLAFHVNAGGLRLSYDPATVDPEITQVKGYTTQEYHHALSGDLRISLAGLNSPEPNTKVVNYSDWTVTMKIYDNTNSLQATFGHGLPFVYVTKTGGDAQIVFEKTPAIWSNSNGTVGVSLGSKHYGIFGPTGSTWTGSAVLQSNLNGQNYFSVALLPDNSPATLEYYRQHAFAFITDTKVTWNYDAASSKLNTTFQVTTDYKEAGFGHVDTPLLALFRHQWLNTNATLTNYTYTSPRGTMKVLEGKNFSTSYTFNGVLPSLPNVATNGVNGYNQAQLQSYVDAMEADPLKRWRTQIQSDNPTAFDTYWDGKAMARLALLIPIADQLGDTTARNLFLTEVKGVLQDWFDGQGSKLFYYDATWDTMIGYPEGFGSNDLLNDHHFHYGYFVMAAAIVAEYDPQWVSQWGNMVEHLIKDSNNWDRTDNRYPFLRYFDPYEGHGWANGPSLFAAGNNQESSSEGMNFATGAILWGEATGNTAIRDLGIYLYTTETAAIEQYWFDIDKQTLPKSTAGWKKSNIAIVWGNGGAHAIWWSGYIQEVYGINFLPLTGGSLYLARHTDNLQALVTAMKNTPGYQNNAWKEIIWNTRALYEPQAVVTEFNADSNYQSMVDDKTVQIQSEWGESRAHTYHWINNLNALGTLDTSVTADIPTYAVFVKGNERTHVAYNSKGTAVTVNFSDGTTMNVPARTLLTDKGGITPTATPTSTTTGSPDLVVTNINLSTETNISCGPLGLSVTFANQGNAAAGPFVLQANESFTTTINGLAAGATGSFWFAGITSPSPQPVIVIDANQNVTESNETNNTYTTLLPYPTPIPTCTPNSTATPTSTSTPTPTATATPAGPFSHEVVMVDSSSAKIRFMPNGTSSMVDVHYKVNNGAQQNFRMTNNNGVWEQLVTGLNNGAILSYSFTYEKAGMMYDSAWFNATFSVGTATHTPTATSTSNVPTATFTPTPIATNTPTPTATSNGPFSHEVVTVDSSSAKIRFIATSSMVDVHYNVNGGAQQNVRMTNNSGTWEQLVTGLTNGATINYSFTYEKSGLMYDSPWFSAIFNGGSTPVPTYTPTPTPTIIVSPTHTPTPTNTPIVTGDFSQGATPTGNEVRLWFTPNGTSMFVDIHYKLNNGSQLNYRMINNNGTWEQFVSGLQSGDVIDYSFTYELGGLAHDSAWYHYAH